MQNWTQQVSKMQRLQPPGEGTPNSTSQLRTTRHEGQIIGGWRNWKLTLRFAQSLHSGPDIQNWNDTVSQAIELIRFRLFL